MDYTIGIFVATYIWFVSRYRYLLVAAQLQSHTKCFFLNTKTISGTPAFHNVTRANSTSFAANMHQHPEWTSVQPPNSDFQRAIGDSPSIWIEDFNGWIFVVVSLSSRTRFSDVDTTAVAAIWAIGLRIVQHLFLHLCSEINIWSRLPLVVIDEEYAQWLRNVIHFHSQYTLCFVCFMLYTLRDTFVK